ncbi:MAG TPA: tRNA (guanosine(46)-N7)-methyltransferase TrmB [Stellaceae bacterium]|nr:tRNA (guanosine(46)-N7)-methyltransferase TrmB [Stellaceae bacterium]
MPRQAPSPAGDAPQRRLVHGRRRGRKLRPGQQELLRSLLPRLRFELPASGRLDPPALFATPLEACWLEIGFGGGEHLAAQAEAHPGIGMLGAEVFENGVVKLLGEVARRGLGTIRLFTDDARLLLAALPEASLQRVFILFPDPWPKLRHHKRRMVSNETLDRLAFVMADGAELRLATDDRDYLSWMLERATDHRDFAWLARGPEDWRQRPADWPPTRYEQKALAAGRVPAFLRFRRRNRQG